MLPDLRIVIAAVVSTFILTVSVGFYTSARLGHETWSGRSDSSSPSDDTPINRIALNWPEPVRTDPALNLDFAVTAKASRNPVRDVPNDVSARDPQNAADAKPPVLPQPVAIPVRAAVSAAVTLPTETPKTEKASEALIQAGALQDDASSLQPPATSAEKITAPPIVDIALNKEDSTTTMVTGSVQSELVTPGVAPTYIASEAPAAKTIVATAPQTPEAAAIAAPKETLEIVDGASEATGAVTLQTPKSGSTKKARKARAAAKKPAKKAAPKRVAVRRSATKRTANAPSFDPFGLFQTSTTPTPTN